MTPLVQPKIDSPIQPIPNPIRAGALEQPRPGFVPSPSAAVTAGLPGDTDLCHIPCKATDPSRENFRRNVPACPKFPLGHPQKAEPGNKWDWRWTNPNWAGRGVTPKGTPELSPNPAGSALTCPIQSPLPGVRWGFYLPLESFPAWKTPSASPRAPRAPGSTANPPHLRKAFYPEGFINSER